MKLFSFPLSFLVTIWSMNFANENYLFMGTYTQSLPHVEGKATGIYSCQFAEDGRLSIKQSTADIENPSYLVLSADKKYLYAVQEGGTVEDSGVYAYAVDMQSGRLTLLNWQSTQGVAPCYLCTDGTGRFLLVANYGTGNVVVYPLAEDGRIADPTAIMQHSGSGPNQARQEGPHAHMVLVTADNQYVLAADLGIDSVVVYKFDAKNGQLEQCSVGEVEPGAGPRHMALHGNGRFLFVLNELNSTLTTFRFVGGQLTPLQTLSTLPEGFSGDSFCAAIRLGENGRFVYASNRGHDSIATFAFDEANELLTLVDHCPTQGKTPRDFILLDDVMLVGNQDSDTVAHYQIDSATGVPQPTGQISSIPTPVCFQY